MKDFHSESLDRTFSEILFVSNVELLGADAAATPASQGTTSQAADPHQGIQYKKPDSVAVISQEDIEVQALEGGKTIGEIYAEYEQIEGQEVSLRAVVVKFSANILGKNWITLQDGTGTAPDNNLVVTSSETVAIGDEVVVKGLVKNNVDIGAGYNYKVLLENASFQ